MTEKICETCKHKDKWHYGKQIGNEEDDCRLIYQDKDKNIKSCSCKKFVPKNPYGEVEEYKKGFFRPKNSKSRMKIK